MTHCPRCNAPLPQPPERFCPSCGTDLGPATPPPTDATVAMAAPPPPADATVAMAPPPPPVPPGGGYGAGGAGSPYGSGGGGGWGTPPPPPPPGGGTPWERRDQIGFGSALVETTQMIYTDPVNFFRGMPTSGGLTSPLLYGVIVGYVGLVASTIYNLVMNSVMGPSLFSGADERFARFASFFEGSLTGAIINLILGPVIIAIALFIGAGITHLVLALLGGVTRGYEATFRVTCYAYAAALLNIVPICGGLLAAVWMIVLLVLGLPEAHGTTRAKAALAVLLPFFVCCCCFGLAMGGVAWMAASAAGR